MKASICICVSGFTQTRGTFHGILKLREELIAAGYSSGVDQRVWYLPWTADWRTVAHDASIVCIQHGLQPIVLVTGYSYGGWGAIQLCNAFEPLGITVEALVMCDPVARPWWLPRPIPAMTSMLGRDWSFPIHVPNNVRNLYEYFQRTNRPQGHRLIYGNGTSLAASVELNYPHDRMDDSKEYHACVLKCARIIREMCEDDL